MFAKLRRRYLPFTTRVKYMPTAFSVYLPEKDSKAAYLFGVFQNAQMVNEVNEDVRKAFVFSPFEDEQNQTLTKEICFGTSYDVTAPYDSSAPKTPLVVSVGTKAELEAALTSFAAAGAGDNVINLTQNFEIKDGETWTSASINGYQGAGVITINGNGHTITGLNAPLLAGGFAGKSGVIINDLTLDNVEINDANNNQGVGAFIGCIDSMPKIELNNCKLTNSTITSTAGARVGGLIGWTSGYNNPNDGPVNTYITIKNCSVENCEITAKGSVGAIIGHAGANPATYHTIEGCTVSNTKLTSTDDGGWRVGVVVGTANVGEVTITGTTSSDNTLTQNGKTAPAGHELYGRFVPGDTGKLIIDGVAVVNG